MLVANDLVYAVAEEFFDNHTHVRRELLAPSNVNFKSQNIMISFAAFQKVITSKIVINCFIDLWYWGYVEKISWCEKVFDMFYYIFDGMYLVWFFKNYIDSKS